MKTFQAALLTTGLGTLCAVGAAFAIAQESAVPAPSTTSTTSVPTPPPAQAPVAPGPDLKDRFSILRDPKHPASAAGTSVTRPEFAPMRGVRAAEVKATATNAGPISVAPASDGLCFSTKTSGSCATAERAIAGQAFALEICSPGVTGGNIHLYGLLPDSVTEATITLSDGTAQTLSVSDNFYSYVGSVVPSSVAWTTAAGPGELSLPATPGVAEAQAACAAR
jgi:hypothetical protein